MSSNRMLWIVGSLAAVALAGALAHDYWPESPRFAVEQPDRIFESLPAGQTHPLTFRVRNLTNKPMRVVGAEFS